MVRIPSWWGRRAAHPENVMAPVELGYAAALLMRAGQRVRVLDVEASGASPRRVLAALARLRPRQVVLQMITPAVRDALELAQKIRRRLPGVERIIAVGQHATVLPATLLGPDSGIDLCIRGEFEQKLCQVLTCQDYDETGLARRGSQGPQVDPTILQVDDLDALPLPAHQLFCSPRYRVFHPTGVRRRWRWGFVLTSRGCPYPCIYCSPSLRNSFGTRYRARSTRSVVQELDLLQQLGCTLIHFKDDVFTLDRQRVEALCEALLARGGRQPWTAQTRPDLVDGRLLRLMRRAGCVTLGMGVESGSQRVLDRLHKQLRVTQVPRAFASAREAGIRTVGFFMLGNPGETEEDLQKTHRLMLQVAPDIIQVAFFTAYPGAPVFSDELLQQLPPEPFSHYNAPMNHSRICAERLRGWQRRFYLDLICKTGFVPRYLWHQTLPSLINLEQFAGFARLSLRFLTREVLR